MSVRQKILVAGKDKEFCDSLFELLSEKEYEVHCAFSGEEAIRMAFSHCPEIVLLERTLSDMDGMQVLEKIREWSLRPVLVLSEQAEETVVAEVLDAGADDYLIKPVRPLELLARIRAAVRHTRTGSGDLLFANEGKIIIGELTIDYDKYRVYVGNLDAGLTQNEFRMVGLLARYNGKVLTYEQVMRELWGPNAGDDNQVLRVNMTNIRRKIEDDALKPRYLFTESGIGYRMVSREEAAQWELTASGNEK